MPARPAAISPTFFFSFLKKKKNHISVKYGASSRPHDSRQQLPVLQRLMDWGAIWNIGLYWGVRGCQAYRHFLCGCVCLSVYPCLGLPFLSPSDSSTFFMCLAACLAKLCLNCPSVSFFVSLSPWDWWSLHFSTGRDRGPRQLEPTAEGPSAHKAGVWCPAQVCPHALLHPAPLTTHSLFSFILKKDFKCRMANWQLYCLKGGTFGKVQSMSLWASPSTRQSS